MVSTLTYLPSLKWRHPNSMTCIKRSAPRKDHINLQGVLTKKMLNETYMYGGKNLNIRKKKKFVAFCQLT